MRETVLKAVVAITTLSLLLALSILLGWALIMLITLVPEDAFILGLSIFFTIVLLYIINM